MRPEGNPLDLNNLPEDDKQQQHSQDSSSSAVAGSYRKKKSGAANKEDLDEAEAAANNNKVYQCRFCSLNFCKSQALGGHMNRHRQERETETLNKARQLVFTNDLAPSAHMGYISSPIPSGDTSGFRSMYQPTRIFSSSSSPLHPPPPPPPPAAAPYMYASPPRLLSFHSQYPPPPPPPVNNDYFVGHVLSNQTDGNYTCIGAPVGHADVAEEVLQWGRR